MPDVRLNYYALAVAIETNCLLEWAFAKLRGEYLDGIRLENMSDTDLNLIRELKRKGMTYREIGELYGVPPYTIYRTLRRNGGKQNGYTPAAIS